LNSAAAYEPVDLLHLWYLGGDQPRLIGDLRLVLSARGVSLKYGEEWLKRGFPLSEDVPLTDIEFLPREKDTAAGAVDDARPDRWGERVIRYLERPKRLSLMEMLYLAGDERFGALGVSSSAKEYVPFLRGPLPTLADVGDIHAVVQKVLKGDKIDERQRRLLAPGATMGGTQPKALLASDGALWVVKFADQGNFASPRSEHAAMTLAKQADIEAAETRLIEFRGGVAVAVKRFDRRAGRRLHAISANVALKAAGADLSYPSLAQLLRRRGADENGRNRLQMRELFRRLVFNILIDNTDDHEKNHAVLMSDSQNYLLAPAYDVLPTAQGLGYQAMVVGRDGASSTIENALSEVRAYGMNRQEAIDEAGTVAKVVDDWMAHFKATGMKDPEIESLASWIDRPALLEQRRALT
jgi:serine/threonine-protein kinase HipA